MEPAGADPEDDAGPVSFLHRRLSAAFDKRVVTLEPGDSRAYRAAEWRDAIVTVEGGQVQLVCADGGHRLFGAGAVLWLAGLGLVALHNPGAVPAVLVAVSRRRGAPVEE